MRLEKIAVLIARDEPAAIILENDESFPGFNSGKVLNVIFIIDGAETPGQKGSSIIFNNIDFGRGRCFMFEITSPVRGDHTLIPYTLAEKRI